MRRRGEGQRRPFRDRRAGLCGRQVGSEAPEPRLLSGRFGRQAGLLGEDSNRE